ncbi:MAG: hypothetical protein JJP05_08770 [cyanobacterium endosymbiont of Rhopalodia gibba]
MDKSRALRKNVKMIFQLENKQLDGGVSKISSLEEKEKELVLFGFLKKEKSLFL